MIAHRTDTDMEHDDDPDAGAPGSGHGPAIIRTATICCGWDFLTVGDVHHHRLTTH